MPDHVDSHSKAYVCIHVFDESAPVLLVSRPEGDWCFLCGAEHNDSATQFRVVGIGHVFERDHSLNEIDDLPRDWEAERSGLNLPWVRRRIASN